MSFRDVALDVLIEPAPLERAGNRDLPILSMTMHEGLVDQGAKFKKRVASANTNNYKLVRRNQLVVGFPIDEGVLSFQNLYDEAVVSPAYGTWRLRASVEVEPAYLERFLRSPRALAFYRAKLRGTTARRRALPRDILLRLAVPLVPLPEQRRISTILDKIDALRAKRRTALAYLDTLTQSIFLDMFGDPVTNPMGWEEPRLEELCKKVIDCPHSTPRWTRSGVVCLRTSNLGKGEWNWTDTRFVSEEDYEERTRRGEILPNDIILSREGTVGVLALVDDDMRVCMGQRLVQPRVNDSQLDPRFLLNFLLHSLAPERLSRLMAGSTSKHLNVKELRKLPALLPPLVIQRRFAIIAESVERQKTSQRAYLAELDTLFASLQSRAFRGDL